MSSTPSITMLLLRASRSAVSPVCFLGRERNCRSRHVVPLVWVIRPWTRPRLSSRQVLQPPASSFSFARHGALGGKQTVRYASGAPMLSVVSTCGAFQLSSAAVLIPNCSCRTAGVLASGASRRWTAPFRDSTLQEREATSATVNIQRVNSILARYVTASGCRIWATSRFLDR